MQIDGDCLTLWNLMKYYRDHLVIATVPREALSMQEIAGGDNNRTPVIFEVPDSLNFVGGINGFRCYNFPMITMIYLRLMATHLPQS
jgi:hypothetical protein